MPQGKPLGFWTLTFLVIANMVGAGIFTTSGFALADLGTPQRVLWAWGVGGAIALCGAVGYGRLAKLFPESGGEYLFLGQALHPWVGTVAGWISLLAGFGGAIAFASRAFSEYLRFPNHGISDTAVAIGVIVLAAILQGHWRLLGAWTQNVSVLLKVVALLLFAWIAFGAEGDQLWQPAHLEHAPHGFAAIVAFTGSLVWISMSYSGFNAAVYVAGESEDAQRIVPRALLLGTTITTLLYLLINVVFVCGPPTGLVAGRGDVAAAAAEQLGGETLSRLLCATVGIALFTSVLSMLMAGPRVAQKMADHGVLPRLFKELRWSAALLVVFAVTAVLFSDLKALLDYLGVTLSLCAAVSVSCIFRRRLRKNVKWSWWDFPPTFYVFATLITVSIYGYNSPRQLIATACTIAIGVLGYFVMARRQPRP